MSTWSRIHRIKKMNRNNRSGHKGIIWERSAQKWKVFKRVDGVSLFPGHFDYIRDAVKMRARADAYFDTLE